VTVIPGDGRGPGAARNIGWRAARGELIWFVDADCVAEPDALRHLRPHLGDESVAAVSGTYDIANDASRLARLIHEEIVERHRSMDREVDFLATFNVLYRRRVLEELDGFDERYLKAQDAELSFRATDAGYTLRFEPASRVAHHHEEHLGTYLRTQRHQGYWRVWLHLEHTGRARGNSYSNWLDHMQPPLALLAVAALPVLVWPALRWIPAGLVALLVITHLPMTWRLLRRLRRPLALAFAGLGALRSLWRGVGMAQGLVRYGVAR
jgi:cellulose synthase/poly-beta-1,6-N-acetylglucosamine synthase-like glycosyltransferase